MLNRANVTSDKLNQEKGQPSFRFLIGNRIPKRGTLYVKSKNTHFSPYDSLEVFLCDVLAAPESACVADPDVTLEAHHNG